MTDAIMTRPGKQANDQISDQNSTPVAAADSMLQSTAFAGPEDYFALLKPRVMSLVIITAIVGMVAAVAAGGHINIGLAIISILAISVGAGASGALNMWFDADIDRVMARTAGRPIPRGMVEPSEAAGFGGFLSALAVALLALSANYVAAGLLAFTIFFYVVIYSMWLKRSTPQNIVIGGAAGALPPVVAWAAVTGSAPLDAWILFLIIFLWTPPHFWALALYREMDYERAGIPMMPNVRGAPSTRLQIMLYALILAIVGLAPLLLGQAGWIYGGVAIALNIGFVFLALKVWRSKAGERADLSNEASLYAVKNGDKAARNLFAFSIIYLFGIFGALAADSFLIGLI